MIALMYASSIGTEKTIWAPVPRCRSTPFTRVTTVSAPRSGTPSNSVPTGQKVSNPLARVH